MGKPSRRVKKQHKTKHNKSATNTQRLTKTESQRREETLKIQTQLNNLGLGTGNQDIQRFYALLEKYCTETDAQAGKIPLCGHKRVLHYQLPQYHPALCTVRLVYDESV